MGAPMPDMEPVENASAEALLSSLKTIRAADRRQHASVFNYWLSIRRGRDFPPIRDLDPLEISDAGPWSILLEMIGGGEDANVRHFGQAIKGDLEVEKIGDAPNPSLLSCIHAKLPIVAACREAFAFEEEFKTDEGTTQCWVTLLPFSANGTWIDYVYGFVSLDPAPGAEAEPEEAAEAVEEAVAEEITEAVEDELAEAVEPVGVEPDSQEPEPFKVPLGPLDGDEIELPEAAVEAAPEAFQQEPEPDLAPEPEALAEPFEPVGAEAPPDPASDHKPGFSKFLGGLASVSGLYGKMVQPTPAAETEEPVEAPAEAVAEGRVEEPVEEPVEPIVEEAAEEPIEPVAEIASEELAVEEPVQDIAEPACEVEGTLQSKLTDVRALAEEAREAQIRSNMALYEGLSAAYDFALDAEDAPEEYLRLVETQGLKIQLRSPMKPVVKLAFEGMCDEPTIKQLEAVLAWALKQDLPRGTLSERIQAEGGLGPILNGKAA